MKKLKNNMLRTYARNNIVEQEKITRPNYSMINKDVTEKLECN